MASSPHREPAPSQPATDDLGSLLAGLRPMSSHILCRFAIPRDDAEDLMQETVCHFLLKRHQVHSPEPWLRSVLRNQCRQYWRKRLGSEDTRARAVAWGLGRPVEGTGGSEADLNTRLDLAMALARLPRSKRELLLRHDLEGESSRELARSFDYQETSIRKTVARVRERLRARLGPHGYNKQTPRLHRKEEEP